LGANKVFFFVGAPFSCVALEYQPLNLIAKRACIANVCSIKQAAITAIKRRSAWDRSNDCAMDIHSLLHYYKNITYVYSVDCVNAALYHVLLASVVRELLCNGANNIEP